MNILIIGNGGREHALAWKAAQKPEVQKVYVAPGNAGTALEDKVSNLAIDVTAIAELLTFAQNNAIDLTIVGPEAPLVAGIVDTFRDAGLRIFGPTQAAAQLEGSKAFAKNFLQRHNIPTAAYANFTDLNQAINYIRQQGAPIVVKADGLAAGKGVILAENEAQAIAAVKDMLSGNAFGEAGHRVVVEEFLVGEEASFIVMVDGKNSLPLASSQDHKARYEGDTGPNTGGMGAYSPAPIVDAEMHQRIMDEIIHPTVAGMAKDGYVYTGFLYAGIMVTPDGTPKVLEFNCRFGDPETQPIMMRLQTNIVDLCLAADLQQLGQQTVQWDSRTAVGVVLAADGYPAAYTKGETISLPNITSMADSDSKLFHAGTVEQDGNIVTSGGRVMCATALGATVTEAQQKAYALVNKVNWKGMSYRTDIAYRAVDRET